jgi:hypothetical protein
MPSEIIPFTTPSEDKAPAPVLSLADKLLVDVADLATLTGLGVRTLRRMDAARDIPGRITCGRRVLFKTEIVREWVKAGLPARDRWVAL